MKNKKELTIIILSIAFSLLVVFAGSFGIYTLAQNAMPTKEESLIVEDVDFGPYMRNMQKEIKSNWNPPKIDTTKRVVVKYTIKKDGSIVNPQIVTSSNNKQMDNAALEALKKTKLSPLPRNYKGISADVQFTFDYNVHK